MKHDRHLKELLDSIKKTDEMIILHKNAGTSSLTLQQYEAIKAKQMSELAAIFPDNYNTKR